MDRVHSFVSLFCQPVQVRDRSRLSHMLLTDSCVVGESDEDHLSDVDDDIDSYLIKDNDEVH